MSVVLEVMAGLGDEDVVEGGLDQLERLDGEPCSSSARTTRRDAGRAVLDLDQNGAVLGGQLAPNRAQHLVARGRPSPSASSTSRCGVADLRLERRRRPLGDDPAAIDDATWSASWSASSRYWVVRNTVVPSALSFAPPPRSPAADGIEAGRRLVEEEHAGFVHQRRGEVEPAAACRPSRCRPGGRRLRSRSTRSSRSSARACPRPPAGRGASPAGGSARGRSSAGRAPPPAVRRRSSRADLGASATTSKPATWAPPPVGAAASSASAPWSSCRRRLGPRKP